MLEGDCRLICWRWAALMQLISKISRSPSEGSGCFRTTARDPTVATNHRAIAKLDLRMHQQHSKSTAVEVCRALTLK